MLTFFKTYLKMNKVSENNKSVIVKQKQSENIIK